MLYSPPVFDPKLEYPTAVLKLPVSFANAPLPIAVLKLAVVTFCKALDPNPRLLVPEVFALNALIPIAWLLFAVLLSNASKPIAVLF